MNTKYAAEICGNMVQNYLKPTVPHLVPDGSGGHTDGAILLANGWSRWRNLIEIGNRSINNIKIAVENASLCGKKYATCAHFAEICEKCGNKWNMRQFALFLFVCTFFCQYMCIMFFLLWAASYDGLMPSLAACHCNHWYVYVMYMYLVNILSLSHSLFTWNWHA